MVRLLLCIQRQTNIDILTLDYINCVIIQTYNRYGLRIILKNPGKLQGNSIKIPGYKRLTTDDFSKEEQPLVEKLAGTLNIGIESLTQALNNRLNFIDNFESTEKTFNIKVDSNGIPTSPVAFKLNFSGNSIPKASGSLVIKVNNLTNSASYPTAGPFITFEQSQSVVTIKHITGLIANNTYEVTVVVFH